MDSEQIEGVGRICLTPILFIFSLIFWIQSSKHVDSLIERQHAIPTHLIATRWIMTTILLVGAISHIFGALWHWEHYANEYVWSSILCWWLYLVIFILVLIFQFLRLYFVFKHTIYALSNTRLICLSTLIIISIISLVVWSITIFIYFFTPSDTITSNSFGYSFGFSTLIIVIIAVVFSMIVTGIFSFNLWNSAIERKRIIIDMKNVSINGNMIKLNNGGGGNVNNFRETEGILLEVIAKHALLCFFQTSFLLFYIYTVFRVFFKPKFRTQFLQCTSLVALIFHLFAWILWGLSLWLSFTFAQKQYTMICHPCHKFCLKVLFKLAQRRIQYKKRLKLRNVIDTNGSNYTNIVTSDIHDQQDSQCSSVI